MLRSSFLLFLVVSSIGLVGCGGGGSDAGGAFNIDRDSVSFSAERNSSLYVTEVIQLQLADSKAAYVGAAFEGTPPDWLYVDVQGSAPNYAVSLRVTRTDLPAADYSATVFVGTADENGNVLQRKPINVSYKLSPKLTISITADRKSAQVVFGADTLISHQALSVEDTEQSWKATSDVPWLKIPSNAMSGDDDIPVTFDAEDLAPGRYTGTITVTGVTDPSKTDTARAELIVSEPTLIPSSLNLTLGGPDGLDDTQADLTFSIDTGLNHYPWNLTLATEDGADWLVSDTSSGNVSSDLSSLTLTADRTKVAGGQFQGTARLSVNVKGLIVSATTQVQFNRNPERLQALSNGVSLTSTPSAKLLSRPVRVITSQGRTGARWAAVSDSPWLSVTASGLTGSDLILTASTDRLAPETQYFATVRLTSPDVALPNTETIRVGLWNGTSTSIPTSLSNKVARIATNPVEPLVYAASSSGKMDVFHAYTGSKVYSYAHGATTLGNVTPSSDGLSLFVVDKANFMIRELDPRSGHLRKTYRYENSAYLSSAELAYARPSGVPSLLMGNGTVVNLESGNTLRSSLASEYYASGAIATSGDGRDVYIHNFGLSPSSITHYRIAWSHIGQEHLVDSVEGGVSPGSNGQDIAVSPDGSRVYSASGSPYVFPVFTNALIPAGRLPGTSYPVSVETTWDGVMAGGSAAYYDQIDLWFYSPDGGALGTDRCAGRDYTNLEADGMRFTGDGMRYACTTELEYDGTGGEFYIRDVPEKVHQWRKTPIAP